MDSYIYKINLILCGGAFSFIRNLYKSRIPRDIYYVIIVIVSLVLYVFVTYTVYDYTEMYDCEILK